MQMSEVGVYTVKDGKIVRGRVFTSRLRRRLSRFGQDSSGSDEAQGTSRDRLHIDPAQVNEKALRDTCATAAGNRSDTQALSERFAEDAVGRDEG